MWGTFFGTQLHLFLWRDTSMKKILQEYFGILFVSGILIAIIVSAGCTGTGGPLVPPSPSPTLQSAGSLTIAGSTTIQPVSEMLAAEYMKDHPGVSVRVEGGGSGSGIQRAGKGEVGLGSSSRAIDPEELVQFPGLEAWQIGGSAIVIIADSTYPADWISREDLIRLYDNQSEDLSADPKLSAVHLVVQRADSSGTEETLAGWLFPGSKNLDWSMSSSDISASGPVTAGAVEGNMEVVNSVKENKGSIGFVDFGYAEGASGIKILRILDTAGEGPLPAGGESMGDAIRKELSGNGDNIHYISKLTRPLLYITNGTPDGIQADFIGYAKSPDAARFFHEVGYFSVTEL
jgi:phosphate transport system substrate-binding protein